MIGVLALQGAFEKHVLALKKLGEDPIYVRTPDDLKLCSALVIPGGESTTIRHLLLDMNLLPALKDFARQSPILGTCAGLILMANDLGVIDLSVERNGFGAQVHSFSHELESNEYPGLIGIFIRAPRIIQLSDEVEVLARFKGEPVLVKSGQYLAATFHPELTEDLRVHQTFVSMVKGVKFPTDHLISSIESDHADGGGHPAKTQTG